MLWIILETYYGYELRLFNLISSVLKPVIFVWTSTWFEWLSLQCIFTYVTFKLYNTVNYLKQVISMMWFVIVTCLYLSLWQLELFACFLFLGEFTILIFFYCLFLHLKASVSQTTPNNPLMGGYLLLFIVAFIFTLWVSTKPFITNYADNHLAYAIDVYTLVHDFVLNDLASLFYYFTSANLSLHALIGFILFILTIFLFVAVTFYTTSNIVRKAAFKSQNSKLFTARGYYEQNAETSQKFFSQSDNNR